jgi:L-histidine N-alpha-methyltransferase
MDLASPPSDRLEIVSSKKPVRTASFADDVRRGLTSVCKRLPSKWFYDDVGSALFDAITLLPEYYLTRAETEILRESGWEIARALGNPVEFVELGSGSATKTRILIGETLRVQRTLRYMPIDICEDALRSSASSLVREFPALSVTAFAGDYFAMLGTERMRREGPVLTMFMGSNLGNYDPTERKALLGRLASSMKRGDGLLLGLDLKKEVKTLEGAYDDPTGVTSAFNLNLLARINRELGGTFDIAAFGHIAKYDASTGSVRSYVESRCAQSVRIEGLDMDVFFSEGERIHTESSYKFAPADIARLARGVGLRAARQWTDCAKRFCVALLVPV